jgi:hypothetical protein
MELSLSGNPFPLALFGFHMLNDSDIVGEIQMITLLRLMVPIVILWTSACYAQNSTQQYIRLGAAQDVTPRGGIWIGFDGWWHGRG